MNVIIQCKYLPREQLNELETVLRRGNPYTSLIDKVEQCKLYINSMEVDLPSMKTAPKPRRKQKPINHKDKQLIDDTHSEKLPSMKTSTDVLSRIFWDDALCVDDFLVGYLDRFLGIIEKPVTDFCWDDISTLNYNMLAIPKHRISYFKYKGWLVWDKEKRLDEVRGLWTILPNLIHPDI